MKMESPIDMNALRVLDRIFKENDITYWLTCGTLLGAVREGKPIEGDFDIDIAIFFEDLLRVYLIRKEFKKYGYSFTALPKPGICKEGKHLICVVPVKIHDGKLVQMYGWNLMSKMGYFVNRHLKSGLPYHLLFLFSLVFNAKRLRWGEYK